DGAIDWLCMPAFDSASTFGSLLDRKQGGTWTLQPTGPFQAERRYVDGTNVLETTFVTDSGRVVVRDLMTRGAVRPVDWNEVVRRVEGLDGEVTLRWRVEPRFDFKGVAPEIEVDHRDE